MFPEGYEDICENVAEAVHNAWMKGRVAEGWRYGSVRSLEEKTDPRICPYDDLPESEKVFDRRTAEATINALMDNGYSIMKNRNC